MYMYVGWRKTFVGYCSTHMQPHIFMYVHCMYMYMYMYIYIIYIYTHTGVYTHIHRALIAGGGAPEIEVSQQLMAYSQSLTGMEAYCVRGFAEAMEIIPYTLAENAGLNPIAVVTELRNRHAKGEKNTGINVRKVYTCKCVDIHCIHVHLIPRL